jgi:hypothetical protein
VRMSGICHEASAFLVPERVGPNVLLAQHKSAICPLWRNREACCHRKNPAFAGLPEGGESQILLSVSFKLSIAADQCIR